MTENPGENWYVIRTKANAEKKVYERLMQLGMDVFLPTYTTLRQWSDRKKKIQVPYIPGHLFIRSTPVDLKNIYVVSGISHVLTEFGKPAVVRDVEITNLRILCEQENWSTFEMQPNIVKGTEVEIMSGAFKGLVGVVTKDGKGSRVHLRFQQIGMTVVLHTDQIRTIESVVS